MRPGPNLRRGAGVLASCALLVGSATLTTRADDPPPARGPFARLFRLGSTTDSSTRPASTAAPAVIYPTPPSSSAPVSTPSPSNEGPAPRISAQPRVSRPATEADPIVTRVAIGKSDNGGQFAMFLQVFADGTVIDGEGVHHLAPDAMRPLMDALRQGDLYRLKGHCGNPSTDFILQTHVVVYERSLGKLRATSFSYSGNPHGCDASVHKLHAALEAIQLKLSSSTPVASALAPNMPTAPSVSGPALTAPSGGTPVLNLSAPNP
jgi:hypothetical protein